MYENIKRSQLSNDVEKLLASEESVQVPLLKMIVSKDVKAELTAKAQSKLEQMKKEQTTSPFKERAVNKSLTTTAQQRGENTTRNGLQTT